MAKKIKPALLIPERWAEVQVKPLSRGSHGRGGQWCFMEAAAYVAGERWSDHPQCVSRVIAAFGRNWNDVLNDEPRQRLKDKIPVILGTRTTEADEKRRAWLAVDWLMRTFTPTWFDLAHLTDQAAALRALPPITSAKLAAATKPILLEAQAKSYVSDILDYSSWLSARKAVRATARDAARIAVGVVLPSAGGLADVMRVADLAGELTWSAGYVTKDSIAPTFAALQDSAFDLIDRMAAVRREKRNKINE